MIQPYLYNFLNLDRQLDPKHGISIFTTIAKIPQPDINFAYKPYYYLHISGEYINPELPVKETIANAISMMIRKGILCITLPRSRLEYDDVSKEAIINNLSLFITGISGIEFCFDIKADNVRIAENTGMINTSDSSFPLFLRMKLKKRPHCLIQEGTTYYSYDYNKRRKSTLKFYNRETWLLEKNNEHSKKFITNNPYKLRIEFVLKRHYNSTYITLNNIDGNYYQIIERFIPYLAKLYRKYFFDKILVNTIEHYYFSQIYWLASCDSINIKNNLENSTQERKTNAMETEFQKYYRLMNVLRKGKKNRDRLLEDPPDNYFAGLGNEGDLKFVTPFDINDSNKIEFQDEEFTILKNNLIYPKMKIIKPEDKNE
jgi:hypothetical protein